MTTEEAQEMAARRLSEMAGFGTVASRGRLTPEQLALARAELQASRVLRFGWIPKAPVQGSVREGRGELTSQQLAAARRATPPLGRA
jgi:hypothetical protein